MIIVTNTNDSGAGSFRQAVLDAAVGEEIQFAVSGTIDLTGGNIGITQDLVITGPGSSNLRLTNSNLNNHIFSVALGIVSISGMTIGPCVDNNGGGLRNETTLTLNDIVFDNCQAVLNGGGAILNNSTLTISNCTITNCQANPGDGGGIKNDGTVTATDLVISGCSSSVNGGGVWSSGTFTQTGGSVSSNTSTGIGGGFFNSGTLTITEVTVDGNTAVGNGGGIHANIATTNVIRSTISANDPIGIYNATSSLIMDNSTVSGNVATGVYSDANGTADVQHSTITNNVFGYIGEAGSVFNVKNTILSGNTTDDVDADTADVISGGYNIFNLLVNPITPAAGDQFNVTLVALMIGSLADNGGPTFTHALIIGSPAIDTGDSTSAPATDQRGFPRVQGSSIDIGAYEFQPTPPTPPTPSADVNVLLSEVKCLGCAGLSVGHMLELSLLIRWLNSIAPEVEVTAESLNAKGKCYACYGLATQFEIFKLALLALIAEQSGELSDTSPQYLMSRSECFPCYSNSSLADMLEMALLSLIENPLSAVGDNGSDPVLGPPYPPVNYQLFIHTGSPRLTWTVPDVLIDLLVEQVDGDGFPTEVRFTATNYNFADISTVQGVGTTMSLHYFEPSTNQWIERFSSWMAPDGIFIYENHNGNPSFDCTRPFANPNTYYFYLSTTNSGVTITSNLIGVYLAGGGP